MGKRTYANRVTVTLPEELHAKLRDRCARLRQAESSFIRLLIARALDGQEHLGAAPSTGFVDKR